MTRSAHAVERQEQQRTVTVRVVDDMAVFRRKDRQLVEPIVRRLVAPYYNALDTFMARRLAHIDEHGRVRLRANLVVDVERELESQGYRVVRRLRRRSTLLRHTADVHFLALDHPSHIRGLLKFLQQEPQGRIDYRWAEPSSIVRGTLVKITDDLTNKPDSMSGTFHSP